MLLQSCRAFVHVFVCSGKQLARTVSKEYLWRVWVSVQVAVEAEVYRGAPELREQVMTSLLAHLLSRLSTQLLDLLPREALCHCNVLMWLGAVSCASAWLQAGVRARSPAWKKRL